MFARPQYLFAWGELLCHEFRPSWRGWNFYFVFFVSLLSGLQIWPVTKAVLLGLAVKRAQGHPVSLSETLPPLDMIARADEVIRRLIVVQLPSAPGLPQFEPFV